MMTQQTTPGQQTIPTIALITDFGLADSYVGVMKGVILSICPQTRLIDITHQIAPQNIQQAAYVLMSAYHYLPPQTVIVAVIDPGVGSLRKPIGIQTERHVLIGPDNGLFSYMLKEQTVAHIVALENPDYHLRKVSTTFHGRDIFSPAGAHVAAGVPLEKLGPRLPRIERLTDPSLHVTPTAIHGEVVYIDHFGNLVTSIGRLTWDADDMLHFAPAFDITRETEDTPLPVFGVEACSVEIKGERLAPLSLSYSSTPKGKVITLINSADHLEIAVNQGSAARQLDVAVGEPVSLHFD